MPKAKEYTVKELNILKRKHLSDEQVSQMINRSESAIHQKRLRIVRDNTKRKQQGVDFTKKLKKFIPNHPAFYKSKKSKKPKKSKKLTKDIYALAEEELIRIKGDLLAFGKVPHINPEKPILGEFVSENKHSSEDVDEQYRAPFEPSIPWELDEKSEKERQDLLPLFEINGVVIVIDKERNEVTITY